MKKVVYLIGSLKNRDLIIPLSNELEDLGYEAFSDWMCPGPDADDFLRDYQRARGRNYKQIINSYAVQNIFHFDKHHIDRSDFVIMVMPAAKSCHLEFGYAVGSGKPAYILFDGEPERVEVMQAFATDVFLSKAEMIEHLHLHHRS